MKSYWRPNALLLTITIGAYFSTETQINSDLTNSILPKPRSLSYKDISCDMSDEDLNQILKSGSIRGFLDFDQFWEIYSILQKKYPDFIGEKFLVGYTFEEDKMEGFFFGEGLKKGETMYPEKNIFFITGLHHSREPLTVTMVVFLMVQILKDRGVCGVADESIGAKWQEFFRTNIILFVPMVNIDSYKFIASNWNGPNGDQVLLIRKNRHIDPTCSIFDGGVDLNRNYDFKFALDNEGSSDHPCSEDFRGAKPFSEPETSSIKKLVELRENIVTGVNMHTYGNAWVYPYNFVYDKKNLLLKQKQPKFYKFYQEFKKEMEAKKLVADFGNTASTIDYSTNGEGGDWLVGKEKIYDIDVELGDLDEGSNTFYPEESLIPGICRYNYLIFRELFWKHNIDLILHRVKRNFIKKEIEMVIYNKSLSSLINFEMEITPEFTGDVVRDDKPVEDGSPDTEDRSEASESRRSEKSVKSSGEDQKSEKSAVSESSEKSKESEKSRPSKASEEKSKGSEEPERSSRSGSSEQATQILSISKAKQSTQERMLANKERNVKIFYAIKVKGNDKVPNPDETIDNKISTTFKGRFYLSIILKFENKEEMKDFERIKALLTYNDGHKQEFLFYLKPDLKKTH